MKRTQLRRRAPLRRGWVPLGRRARERVRAGGPLAVGRPSATLAEWRAVVARCLERANHRCEYCGARRALDPHHVRPRAQGGEDSQENTVVLCRACHERCAAPYRLGRLLVVALGLGRFCFRLVRADHKGAPQTVVIHAHTPTSAWLGAQGRWASRCGDLSGCPAA